MSLATTTLRASLFPRSSALTRVLFVTGGVIFLSALAQVAFPIPGSPGPFTGQTLGVLLLSTSYGATLGMTTFAVYLLAGIAGAPIFANGSYGIEKVVGATGGYLVGMLIASFVLGTLAQRRLDQKFITALPAMLLGNLIIFTFGLMWLHQFTGKDWAWTLNAGLTPFIFGEVIKIAIAGTSLPILWRFVQKKIL
jgi:biotin transport system substrate-specific component